MNNLFNIRRGEPPILHFPPPSSPCPVFTVALNRLQNYLLGRKETSEMADRNKEALLEVKLYKLLTSLTLMQVRTRKENFNINFCSCVCIRSVSVAALCQYRR